MKLSMVFSFKDSYLFKIQKVYLAEMIGKL